MSAAAVTRHQLADVRLRRAVEDAVSEGDDDELALLPVEDARLNVRLRIHRVNQKAIAGGKFADAAKIGDDHIPFDARVLAHDFLECLLLFEVAIDALANIRLL